MPFMTTLWGRELVVAVTVTGASCSTIEVITSTIEVITSTIEVITSTIEVI